MIIKWIKDRVFGRKKAVVTVGSGRSKESQQAITRYELPISLFTRETIFGFVSKLEMAESDMDILLSLPIVQWKFIAEQRVGVAGEYLTGSSATPTPHYSVTAVVNYILSLRDNASIATAYKFHKNAKKAK